MLSAIPAQTLPDFARPPEGFLVSHIADAVSAARPTAPPAVRSRTWPHGHFASPRRLSSRRHTAQALSVALKPPPVKPLPRIAAAIHVARSLDLTSRLLFPQVHAEIMVDVPVEHGLLMENLLDLAHAPFTHTTTFARGWPVPDFVKFHANKVRGWLGKAGLPCLPTCGPGGRARTRDAAPAAHRDG